MEDMKREIIFRGLRVDNGEWIHGNIQVPNPPFDKWFMWDENHWQQQVDKETVGQFTGLTDKNGTKIFSNDILSDGTKKFRVYDTVGGFALKAYYWCEDMSDLTPSDELILQPLPDAQTRSWIEGCCEVIGNIHEPKNENDETN